MPEAEKDIHLDIEHDVALQRLIDVLHQQAGSVSVMLGAVGQWFDEYANEVSPNPPSNWDEATVKLSRRLAAQLRQMAHTVSLFEQAGYYKR